MKVSIPRKTADVTVKPNEAILPLIPENPTEIDMKDPTKVASFKLRTVPADANSPLVNFSLRIAQGYESPREIIEWCINARRVVDGLNLNAAGSEAGRLDTIRSCCRGTILNTLNESVQTWRDQDLEQRQQQARANVVRDPHHNDAQHQAALDAAAAAEARQAAVDDCINHALNEIVKTRCPYKALEKQKRFMRRKMRKPAEMRTREYVNRLRHINYEELPKLPPFDDNQRLADDEMIDILIYGLPKSWIKEMDRQDFDPFAHPIMRSVEFCERMESSEDFQPEQKKSSPAQSKKKHKSSDGGAKYCEYHGKGNHSTQDCEVIKKMIASAKNNKGERRDKPKFGNKTWRRSADDAKKSATKDLAAVVAKQVKKAMKKELHAVSRKRSSDDSSSDGELNNVDFDKLSIDSDDEVST